jgi:hypothetical protein
MFEQERSAFFGMALVAIVIDRVLPEERFGSGTMWIMTVGASHFAFAHWHVRRPEHLRAAVLVALETGFKFSRRLQIGLG